MSNDKTNSQLRTPNIFLTFLPKLFIFTGFDSLIILYAISESLNKIALLYCSPHENVISLLIKFGKVIFISISLFFICVFIFIFTTKIYSIFGYLSLTIK
jgi:hypothetical protein